MELAEHYNNLYNEAIKAIQANNNHIDDQINLAVDNRVGITLRIRPAELVAERISYFQDKLRQIEPSQYYYPDTDIHVTVMSIIACYNGFNLNQISINNYIELIKESIRDLPPFKISFRGVTASASCIMIQGFTDDETLNTMRNNIRIKFKNSDLQQSIDVRYAIQTAHSTVVRFPRQIVNTNQFIEVLENFREFDFGCFTADSMELVYNDWYHKNNIVKVLYKFRFESLKSNNI